MTTRRAGPAPVIGRCVACGAKFTSRYGAKNHACPEPAKTPEKEAVDA